MDLPLPLVLSFRLTMDRLVDRRGPYDCWPWRGTLGKKGYGQFASEGVTYLAHRVAFVLFTGYDPGPLDVCHRCDEPSCCNPAHLTEDSRAGNQVDKRLKGRAAKGEANRGGGKLKETDIPPIREMLAQGMTKTAIAEKFGISSTEVYFIEIGRHWSHVA